MKLFIRDHWPFVALYGCNMFLLFLFYAKLGGFNTLANLCYFLFLSGFFLIVFLFDRYLRHRKLYQKLSHMPTNLEETLSPTGDAPLPQAIDTLLRAQYHRYQEQIHRYKRKHAEHLTFVHQWVHQMKTPLSVIHLLLQENEGELYTEKIGRELERIRQGLKMALYVARLGRFEADFHVETVQLHAVVAEVINEQKRYFIRKKIYPAMRVDSQLSVKSDRKWLKFMIEQLLVNAIKYTEGENKRVSIIAAEDDQQKILEVKDQGIGIPKEDLRRVFEPFYTGKNGRRFGESTGMGLYLVHEVCNKLGHQLELESSITAGTTVRMIFKA